MRCCLALLLVLPIAGCGGAPTGFYTLTPVRPAAHDADAPGCQAAPVGVGRVVLPETLDRQSMIRIDGPDRIDISSQNRWAAPLDSIIRHVLAEDLRDRLPADQILLPGDAQPPGGSAALDVSIQRFAGDTTGHVVLQADWTLLDRGGKPVLTRSEALSTNAASPGTDAVVAAMSGTLGQFADRIVVVLQGCPRAERGAVGVMYRKFTLRS